MQNVQIKETYMYEKIVLYNFYYLVYIYVCKYINVETFCTPRFLTDKPVPSLTGQYERKMTETVKINEIVSIL